jgi:hypothetical protein
VIKTVILGIVAQPHSRCPISFMELVLVVEESSRPLPIHEELRGGVLFVHNALVSLPMVIPRSGSY